MTPRITGLLALSTFLGWAAPDAIAGLRRDDPEFAEKFRKASRAERQAVVRKEGVKQTALDLRRDYLKTLDTSYSVKIPIVRRDKKPKDQGPSGRCWIFAATHVLESDMVQRGLTKAHLSDNFANYHAWRTRSLAMLERIASAGEPVPVNLQHGYSEGGWFHWASQLIEKHGMVPSEVMPETYDATSSGILTAALKDVLARAQADLHAARKDRTEIIARAQREIDHVLDGLLGTPPERFTYRDKTYTPVEYAREVLGFKPRKYVVLTNLPSSSTESNTAYRWRGELGFAGTTIFNVSPKLMLAATRATLDRGEAVWFTAQMGDENPHMISSSERVPPQARNALHIAAFDYRLALGVPFAPRQARIDADTGWGNHAMAFDAYDAAGPRSAVRKLRVNNSWQIVQHMYRDFFEERVDMVVVPHDALPPAAQRRIAAEHPEKFPLPIPR